MSLGSRPLKPKALVGLIPEPHGPSRWENTVLTWGLLLFIGGSLPGRQDKGHPVGRAKPVRPPPPVVPCVPAAALRPPAPRTHPALCPPAGCHHVGLGGARMAPGGARGRGRGWLRGAARCSVLGYVPTEDASKAGPGTGRLSPAASPPTEGGREAPLGRSGRRPAPPALSHLLRMSHCESANGASDTGHDGGPRREGPRYRTCTLPTNRLQSEGTQDLFEITWTK